MKHPLDPLARRVEDDPAFLGCLLRLYAQSEGLAEERLVEVLGCQRDTLNLLRLCRAPAEEARAFQKGVEEISRTFTVHPDALADVLRRGQALIQLSRPGPSQGTLTAARDAAIPTEDKR
ncbi:MAG TPA: hypothetical protein VKU02_29075 [Gemmataceae bacterium]|nr:hypothetical protein [Gemmataceae bacterium]